MCSLTSLQSVFTLVSSLNQSQQCETFTTAFSSGFLKAKGEEPLTSGHKEDLKISNIYVLQW